MSVSITAWYVRPDLCHPPLQAALSLPCQPHPTASDCAVHPDCLAHSPSTPTVAQGRCHGTLGELLQGPVLHRGKLEIGLISLPLPRYSQLRFQPGAADGGEHGLAHRPLCRAAVALYLQQHGLSLPPGRWFHHSELLPGKGMASSTADLVAAIRCLDQLFGRVSSLHEIIAVLRPLERSDSVFLDHYALYLSERQLLLQRFAHAPRLHACYADEGGTVATAAVTAALQIHYAAQRGAYQRNLEQMLAAFAAGDDAAIAHCAGVSAALGQDVLPKRHLADLQRQQPRFGAAGIVVAHTGSLVGYLFLQPPPAALRGELAAFFRDLDLACAFSATGC